MRLFKRKIEGKTAEEWFALAKGEKDPEKKVEYYTNARIYICKSKIKKIGEG